jgi:hypothetical protein
MRSETRRAKRDSSDAVRRTMHHKTNANLNTHPPICKSEKQRCTPTRDALNETHPTRSAARRTFRPAQILTRPTNPKTLKATTQSETRRPKRDSLDAVSRTMHHKTNANSNTHHPAPKPQRQRRTPRGDALNETPPKQPAAPRTLRPTQPEATTHSETRRPKRDSLDATSRATHLNTHANLNTHPQSPQTLEATTHSETRRPKRDSVDAASRATHLKNQYANLNTNTPAPNPRSDDELRDATP